MLRPGGHIGPYADFTFTYLFLRDAWLMKKLFVMRDLVDHFHVTSSVSKI